MAEAQRTVRQLRLSAPSEAAVRRLMPTLEDALRCASLGDEGARLIVVRKVALGRLPAGISPQALSRLIEERTAEAARQWVDGASAEAEQAPSVAFASALDARVQLASRLLRGQRCKAWYWPLAVAEFEPQADAAGNVRRIASAVARWPEARVALPAWVAALVREGLAAQLSAAIAEAAGEALMQAAGHPLPALPHESSQPAEPLRPSSDGTDAAPAARVAVEATARPRWLQRALQAATASGGAAPRDPAPSVTTRAGPHPAPPVHAAAAVEDTDAPAPARGALADTAPRSLSQSARTHAVPAAAAPEGTATPGDKPAPGPGRRRRGLRTPDPIRWPWRAPTDCGGLLLLLPVLARLGLPQRLGDDEAACRFTAGVLHLALQRAHAPPDDPMWQLVLARAADVPPEAAAALADARRWLQRAGRIGLVRLVRRPARVSWTPTHVDLHFALDQCELRVRRLGLDLDPGWLPWFGRVVGFHYLPRDA